MLDTTKLVNVGALKGPHGLKGLVKAKVTLDDPELLVHGGGFWDVTGHKHEVLDWQAVGQGLLALKLARVVTLAHAETVRGPMWMDPAAWPRAAGEVYLRECIGWEVRLGNDVLGVVVSVQDLGGQTALAVAQGADSKAKLVPLAPECLSLREGWVEVGELGVAYLAI